jgi:hypothetical protein
LFLERGDQPVTFVKLTIRSAAAALALAGATLITPASATISTPFGGISAGGFGLPSGNFAQGRDFGISTRFGGSYGIGFGPFGASFGGFGLGNSGPGAGGYYTGFAICHPPYCPPQLGVGNVGGVLPSPGASEPQALSVGTPWGGFSGPGFGINFGPFSGNFGGFGLAPQQALGVSTPFGGFSGPGFGISTPWGGINMGGFGFGGQPQIIPIYLPYPY